MRGEGSFARSTCKRCVCVVATQHINARLRVLVSFCRVCVLLTKPVGRGSGASFSNNGGTECFAEFGVFDVDPSDTSLQTCAFDTPALATCTTPGGVLINVTNKAACEAHVNCAGVNCTGTPTWAPPSIQAFNSELYRYVHVQLDHIQCGVRAWTMFWSTSADLDLGEDHVNALFARSEHGIVRRLCSSCVPSHREIYYRRLPGARAFDPYRQFKTSWHAHNNRCFPIGIGL